MKAVRLHLWLQITTGAEVLHNLSILHIYLCLHPCHPWQSNIKISQINICSGMEEQNILEGLSVSRTITAKIHYEVGTDCTRKFSTSQAQPPVFYVGIHPTLKIIGGWVPLLYHFHWGLSPSQTGSATTASVHTFGTMSTNTTTSNYLPFLHPPTCSIIEGYPRSYWAKEPCPLRDKAGGWFTILWHKQQSTVNAECQWWSTDRTRYRRHTVAPFQNQSDFLLSLLQR